LHLEKQNLEILPEKGGSFKDEKIKSNKNKIVVAVLILLGLFCSGYVVKDVLFPVKECMQWQNDHYELVDCKCETEGFVTLNQIKPVDPKEVSLRKIKVDKKHRFTEMENQLSGIAK
jgi:hypothetical protein